MHLFYQEQLPEVKHLDQDESKHCIKVLRLQTGDQINIIDGKGTFYTAKITEAHPKNVSLKLLKHQKKPSLFFIGI